LLFARHPSTRILFVRTDPRYRELRFKHALEVVLSHLDDDDWLDMTLRTVGAQHLALGATRHTYDWGAECLMIALAEASGSAWTPHVARAWEDALDDITERIIEGAAEADTLVDADIPSQPPAA
jgi:hemoglobin-like flavoprotein